MLRDNLRDLIERETLVSVLDSLSAAVLDMSDECGRDWQRIKLERIGKTLCNLRQQASGLNM